MFATGETVGLAEWIIDDTCLVRVMYNTNWLSGSLMTRVIFIITIH